MTDVKPRLSLNRPHKDTPAPERVESTLTSTRGHTVNVAVYRSTSAEKERPRRTRFSDSQGGGRGSRSSFKERRHGGSRPFEGRREFEREEKAERAFSSPRKERPEGPSVSVDRSGPHPVRHFKKGVSVVSRGSETRAAAALCVTAIEEGRSLNEALPYYTRDLDVRDKAFVSEIVHGTLRHRRLLGATLQPLLTVKINEHYRPARNLLLTALYQLSFMRTPAHAVVAATVGASSLCDCRRFTATLNAVLRRFLREGAHLAKDVSPAVEESCPDWLYERLTEAYGQERTLEILRCSNDHPPLWLRVESSAISPQDFMSLLDRAGLPYRQSTLLPEAILLEEPLPVPDIPGFREGYFSVQDISAQLSAPLLADGLSPDASPAILDCCAAPGGKSAHLLDLLPHARLTALEKDPHRAASIEDTLTRLKRKAQVQVADASDLEHVDGLLESYDRILVDAPCSGTGVIRRHPDIKWLRRRQDIEILSALQSDILEAAVKKLAPGGVLLYTTCSLLPEENRLQIGAFLARHPELALSPFRVGDKLTDGTLQRLTGEDNGDGFFYARLVRVK